MRWDVVMQTNQFLVVITVAAALGSGLIGGVYYAFSAFVMRGLGALPPPSALGAMNAINRAAPRAPLTIPLVGTALACLVLGVAALRHTGESAAWLALAGCVLYLASFGITAAYHVPRNDALLRVDPASSQVVGAWAGYAAPWTRWNHVRGLAALAGSVLLVASQLA
jgi:uncharacterized membrane protein